MSFPYTFPFVFDGPIFLTVIEAGTGNEISTLKTSFASSESGTATESGIGSNNVFTDDGGGGADIIKILTGKAGHDLRLQTHFGQVNITHKEVNL